MPSSTRKRTELAALVDLGITAVRHGRHERARRFLEAALAIDPTHEDGLLWLAAITDDRDQANAMVRRALRHHPDSSRAQAALRWLDQPSADTAAPPEGDAPQPFRPPWEAYGSAAVPRRGTAEAPAAPGPGVPVAEPQAVSTDVLPWQPPAVAAQEDVLLADPGDAVHRGASPAHGRPSPPAQGVDLANRPQVSLRRARLGWGTLRNLLMVAMLATVFLGGGALAVLLSSDAQAQSARVALGAITRTPTPTHTPQATATATPSPTATATITPLPSATPLPTATATPSPTPLPTWATAAFLPLPLEEKWIEVDLTQQMLYAWEGTETVYSTEISSGKDDTPTRVGRFRIRSKHVSQHLVGPGYSLPDVPFVMYYSGAFAIHAAYWHDQWGAPVSHGCINMRREDAQWLFEWADPQMPEGAKQVQATVSEPGTWVLIHK